MTQIIIAFRSRTESLQFSDYLGRAGVPATLLNTPRELSTGCGVSVGVDERYLGITQSLLMRFNAKKSYFGMFKILKNGIRMTVIPIG